MKTIYATSLHTGKTEQLTNSGRKDEWGKVIWIDKDGHECEVQTSRHFGKTNYYFSIIR